jgi:hypothetical protein
MCARQVPGDTNRNPQVRSRHTNQTFKHTLMPVWLLTYVYGSRTYQVLVSGYAGTTAGRCPRSVVKALLLGVKILFAGSLPRFANMVTCPEARNITHCSLGTES